MEIFLISAQPIEYDEDKISFNGVKNIVTNNIYFLEYSLNLDDVDALIFTSKNAIKSLIYNANRLNNHKWQIIDSFVFGESSACYLKDNGGRLAYVKNNGNGNEFAKELCSILKDKKAIYLRAKKVISNLGKILDANNIDILEILAYESKVKNIDLSLKPPPKSILIFTAPSVYRAFLYNFSWDDSYIAIAIGDTTLNSFLKNIVSMKSPKQTIQSCIEVAREIQAECIKYDR